MTMFKLSFYRCLKVILPPSVTISIETSDLGKGIIIRNEYIFYLDSRESHLPSAILHTSYTTNALGNVNGESGELHSGAHYTFLFFSDTP